MLPGLSAAILAAVALPPTPTYVSSAAGASASSASCTPAYPSSPQSGDIFILETLASAASGTPVVAAPAGFTEITHLIGSAILASVFYKISNGTETGTITVTETGIASPTIAARMHLFRGANATTPYDHSATASGFSTTPAPAAITTTSGNCLVVQCTCIYANVAQSSFTGESGADYTEAVAEYTAASPTTSLGIQTAAVAAPTAITGGSFTTTSSAWISIGFDLHA